MTVKNRLAIQFTTLFAVLLLIALSLIYLYIERYRKASFYTQLDDRALTVAQFYLAQDNLSADKFQEVLHKLPHSLAGEHVNIYNEDLKPVLLKEDTVVWSQNFLKQIKKKHVVYRSEKGSQIVGLYYTDNSGNFLFVVSAIDHQGIRTIQQLKVIMLTVFVILLMITFFLGRLFARSSLQPLITIRDNLRNIRATDLHKRLEASQANDEIASLSSTINQLLEHLEQSFDSQRSFVAHASHELRTPLTSILGQAETTLIRNREPEEYRETLNSIIHEVIHLNQIITSLMDLMEMNMDISDFHVIQVDELVWEISDEFRMRYDETRLEIIQELTAEVGQAKIFGNRQLLFIAVNNILNNALKFSEDQSVCIRISSDEKMLRIEVIDKGIGISKTDQERIFEPFFRSVNATRFPGHGIGLSLSQNIIRLHHGNLNVISELNTGTTFIIGIVLI